MLKIVSCAEFSAINLEEIKNCLKISHQEDDEFIINCIKTSLEIAESFMSISLRPKTIELQTSYVNSVNLPLGPLIYLDKVLHLPSKDITKDCQVNYQLPSINFPYHGNFKITYTCGFEDKTLPYAIRQGILAHTCAIFDRQVIDNDFLNQVFNFYKPFRKILI